MIWPLAPWRWVDAVSTAVVGRSCPVLRLCCQVGSCGDESDVFDGMPLSAPSPARDGSAAMVIIIPTIPRRGGSYIW